MTELLTDALLLRRVTQENKYAFSCLYEKYWQMVYSDAYKRLKDEDQAKDIVQDIFTHIWLKRETLQIDNLPAYLHVAVRNQAFKLLEKQKITHPFFDLLENIPSAHTVADGHILYKEFVEAYDALLNTLPHKRQIIFRMRFQEDLSTTDIANQLGLSRKTVQNQLGKAFDQLKVPMEHITLVLMFFLLKK